MYYFYDGIKASNLLEKYNLDDSRSYRYLRIPDETNLDIPRDNQEDNIKKYEEIIEVFRDYGFKDEDIELVHQVVCAVILLGDVRFQDGPAGKAEIQNEDCASKVAELLKVDAKKLCWALTNYCVVDKSVAIRKRHTSDEARDARDVLANTMYSRLLDYIVNIINHKLAYGRAIL